MSLEIKQNTERKFKRPRNGMPYFPGVSLGDLLDYLTELQANGVPDDACIGVQELWVRVNWVEKR